MKYPSLFAAICVASGSATAKALGATTTSIAVILLLAGLALVVLARQIRRHIIVGPSPALFLAASICFLFGSSFLNSHSYSLPNNSNISRVASLGRDVSLIGEVEEISVRRYGGMEVEFRVYSIVSDSITMCAAGIVLIQAESISSDVHLGDRVLIAGRLEPPPKKKNPYDFNATAYYARRGISAVMSIRDLSSEHVDHSHNDISVRVEVFRQKIRERIRRAHSNPLTIELLPALLLGVRSDVSPQTREVFRKSGLSHLLAISGLHVGILAWSFYWMVGLFLGRMRVSFLKLKFLRCGVTLSALWGFYLLSGGAPSVQRAVLMATLVLLSGALGRQTNGWNVLGLTACLLLMRDPGLLFDIGFQLSFSAVAGILVYTRGRLLPSHSSTKTPAFVRFIYSSFGISVAATSFTLPVILFHFGGAPLGGILTNIVAIPLMTLLVYSGIFSSITGGNFFLGDATHALAALLSKTASLSSSFFEPFTFTAPSGVILVGSLAPLLLFSALFAAKRRNRTLLVGCTVLILWVSVLSPEKHLVVTFLDVGQGDAAVVLTPNGKTVVVDVGPGFGSAAAIENHLAGAGYSQIDLLLLSHYHDDHIGGWSRLVDKTRIIRAIGPSAAAELSLVEEKYRGDTLSVDPAIKILVLSPPKDLRGVNGANDSSLIVKIIYGSTSFLFTGDAEMRAESELVAAYDAELNSTIVKVPHHGSKTSSSNSFVNRSAPTWAVVSVGQSNTFGHPDSFVLERWKRAGSEILRTDKRGGITFESDGESVFRSANQ